MSAFLKEFARTVAKAPGRFLALAAIVALGAGFYAGLRMTAPDMYGALDAYLDAGEVYDVRVVGTMGLDEDDLAALAELPAIEQVEGAREVDVLAELGGADYTMRIHSYPAAAETGPGGYLDHVELYEGRWPTGPGECLIAGDRVLAAGADLGDVIEIERVAAGLDDPLATRSLTIVGKVHTSYYVSSAAIDSSSLGSGVVQQVLYVPGGAFADSMPFSEAFATVCGAAGAFYGSAEYDALVGEAISQVEGIAEERCEARYDAVRDGLYDRATTFDGLLDLVEYRLGTSHEELENPELPTWLVMGRDKNAGTASFTADADRIEKIAQVFPTVFFLVAALVALTTMTRMVDEERQLIGVLKALGYSRRRIMAKYLGYAALASGVGALIGITLLGSALPYIIMFAYSIIYYVPCGVPLPDARLGFLALALSMGITLAATWFAVATTLRERPSALMLPRAPKAGQRIWLERARPVWKRLSFSWKVTCRNLFRYKKRLVMTVIGIAGTTALLLTGLGLHDSISDIIDIQYGEIVHNNLVVSLEDDVTTAERAAFDEVFARGDLVEESAEAFSETMLATGPRASDKRVDVVSPADDDAFAGMKTLRTRVGHEPLAIPAGRALMNEKLADELGLTVGDAVQVRRQDAMGNAEPEAFEVVVGGLYENYLYNYIYVDVQTFAGMFGEEPEMNAVFAVATVDAHEREELDALLKETGCVRIIAYNDEVIDTYRTMLRSVDLVMVVLIVAAAALAFIVLYSLTNINIAERVREIATLKVLGFTRGETNAYIFREVALLSVLGALLGLAFGTWLEGFVITTAEVDQVMFGRAIHLLSYVTGFVGTLAFTAIAMVLMVPKLRRIDMVESLKSNE